MKTSVLFAVALLGVRAAAAERVTCPQVLCFLCGTVRQAAIKENQKAKGKNQKAKISAPGRGPDWGGIFRGWPQSKQSSMIQCGIFVAREEMGL